MVEARQIVAVNMPSMAVGVGVVNDLECAHRLKYIILNGVQSDAYWFIFENFEYWDSTLFRDKVAKEYPQLKII